MRIGELSRVTGVSTRALRYYDEHQLLPSTRLGNGYRDYPEDAAEVVAFIQDLFAAGLPSDLVRDTLTCLRGGACDLDQFIRLRERVVQVRDRLEAQERQVAHRRRTLEAYLAASDACDRVAACDRVDPCRSAPTDISAVIP